MYYMKAAKLDIKSDTVLFYFVCDLFSQCYDRGNLSENTYTLYDFIIVIIDIFCYLLATALEGINRIYHHFVQGQGNPPKCQRFAVHNEACRVVEVVYL